MEGTRLRGAKLNGGFLDLVNVASLSEGPAMVLPVQFDPTAGMFYRGLANEQ